MYVDANGIYKKEWSNKQFFNNSFSKKDKYFL